MEENDLKEKQNKFYNCNACKLLRVWVVALHFFYWLLNTQMFSFFSYILPH